MSKQCMSYFEREDVLHLAISDEPEAGSVEVGPNITAELNAEGELIGIEIIGASAFIRDSVLDSVQARLLQLGKAAAETG
jgi:uncharacterized protein YuzE